MEVQNKYKIGVNKIADIVGSTMGAYGKFVEYYRGQFDESITTKDGATVAKFVSDEDVIVNTAITKIQSACRETNSKAGDGTTGTAVLARALFNNAYKYINDSTVSIPKLKLGMDKAGRDVLQFISEKAIKANDSDLINIATIACNNDEKIGRIVFEAFKTVNFEGHITYKKDYNSAETNLDIHKGITIDFPYSDERYANNKELGIYEKKEALLICYEDLIDKQEQIITLAKLANEKSKDLVLVCRTISKEVEDRLIVHNKVTPYKVIIVKGSYNDSVRSYFYDDICSSFGKISCTKLSCDLTNLNSSFFDTYVCEVSDVVLTKDFSKFGGATVFLEDRIKGVTKALEDKNLFDSDILLLKQRLRVLQGSTAVINIGGHNDSEIDELEDRIEDAINSIKNAYKEGFVPGGGTAYLKAKKLLRNKENDYDIKRGYQIVLDSLDSCFRQNIFNAGENEELRNEVMLIKDFNVGYNLVTKNKEDLILAGVIDPYTVIKNQILNSISVVGVLINTSYVLHGKSNHVSGLLPGTMK